MKTQFHSYIQKELPFLRNKKLLLAVSGGLDSMVLYHLCKTDVMDIAVAHCNFNLRGAESEAETTFVKTTMAEAAVQCFTVYFDTYAYAEEKKVSTQMAARELRYTWFKELASAHGFDYILTAHHANDSAETLLINLSRGTGLKGLTGIPTQNGKVVRPLLGFSRKQLKEYAITHKIRYKEDSSNACSDYLRNDIRLHAIPALEKATPSFLEGVARTQEYVRQSEALLEVYKSQLQQEYTYPIHSNQESKGFCIDLLKLAAHPEQEAVLYALLSDYGFTAWQDIYRLPNAQSGKKVVSQSHTILKDRDRLQVIPKGTNHTKPVVWIGANEQRVSGTNWEVELQEVLEWFQPTKNEIFVDRNLLTFPLLIRTWQEGDYFFPLGLGGKKKLSKFFKDEKLSLTKKQEVLLLCSNNDIVWVIGMRPDDRFKVTNTTSTIIKISYTPYEV